jgi:pimeloyl-ACP methyl ester carboxylesterase
MSSTVHTPTGIAYDRMGSSQRPPVVLIHAGIADRRMWDPQWDSLTLTHDAIRLDLRGFGASTGRPAGPLDHVADVVDTLTHLGVTRCHLVGASLGAGVATEVALVRPDLAQSLLLCPPGGSLLATLTPDLKDFFDAERSALARDDVDAAVDVNVTTWLVGPGRTPADLDPRVLAAVREMQANAFRVAASWGEVDETELQPPALDRLGELAMSVLVLLGGHDLEAVQDSAERVCAGTPHVRRVDWADVAHLPSMEKPQEFLSLLLDWLDRLDGEER